MARKAGTRGPRREKDPALGKDASTVRDVAARAGVSASTVSRVLGGTYPVASATKAKVLRAMRELDYVVNAHIARGVEEQAAAEGRLCMLCTTHGDPQRVLAVVETMREQRADAVIVVGGAGNFRPEGSSP